jgi:hypothetical protein
MDEILFAVIATWWIGFVVTGVILTIFFLGEEGITLENIVATATLWPRFWYMYFRL